MSGGRTRLVHRRYRRVTGRRCCASTTRRRPWSSRRTTGEIFHVAAADGLEEPRLDTPAVVTVLRAAGVPGDVRPTIRSTVHDALRAAASARVHGVLRERRRRHYGHAALLAACCVELDTDRAVRWAADLRERTRR